MQPGIIKKIEDKLEKVGDVIQEKLEAAGNFLESEWNKHNFGPALVIFLNILAAKITPIWNFAFCSKLSN